MWIGLKGLSCLQNGCADAVAGVAPLLHNAGLMLLEFVCCIYGGSILVVVVILGNDSASIFGLGNAIVEK